MLKCTQCESLGLTRRDQDIFKCTLCGQARCEEHSVWVPTYAIEECTENARRQLDLLSKPVVKGWYTFCGRLSHRPVGAPIRHGKERKWGKVIERIPYDERVEGLEIFPLWQTGIIEDGLENHWEPQRYDLSCNLSLGMRLMAGLFQHEGDSDTFVEKVHSVVIDKLAAKKPSYFHIPLDEFKGQLPDSPSLKELAGAICSRCGVVFCLNRLGPFYDDKLLKTLAKKPESVLPM